MSAILRQGTALFADPSSTTWERRSVSQRAFKSALRMGKQSIGGHVFQVYSDEDGNRWAQPYGRSREQSEKELMIVYDVSQQAPRVERAL